MPLSGQQRFSTTVVIRPLHSEPSMSTTANFSTILADVEASFLESRVGEENMNEEVERAIEALNTDAILALAGD